MQSGKRIAVISVAALVILSVVMLTRTWWGDVPTVPDSHDAPPPTPPATSFLPDVIKQTITESSKHIPTAVTSTTVQVAIAISIFTAIIIIACIVGVVYRGLMFPRSPDLI